MSDDIAEALLDCIMEADEDTRAKLFSALHAFRSDPGRSYFRVREQPFARKLIDAINEAEQLVDEGVRECAS